MSKKYDNIIIGLIVCITVIAYMHNIEESYNKMCDPNNIHKHLPEYQCRCGYSCPMEFWIRFVSSQCLTLVLEFLWIPVTLFKFGLYIGSFLMGL